jgi:hypothetical protein
MDNPIYKGLAFKSLLSIFILIGNLCTTLIQFPVAFCAGIKDNSEPVELEIPSTIPW